MRTDRIRLGILIGLLSALTVPAGGIVGQYLLRPVAANARGLPFSLFDGQRAHTSRCVFWQGQHAVEGAGLTISLAGETRVRAVRVFTCDPNHLAWTQTRTEISAWDAAKGTWRTLAAIPDVTGRAADPKAVKPLIETTWQGEAVTAQFLRVTLQGAGIWLSEVRIETDDGILRMPAPKGEPTRQPTVIALQAGSDMASGSSRYASVWRAPKAEDTRFYIGHANHFDHLYRAVVKADITPFLLPTRVERAYLVVRLGAVFGSRPSRVLAVEHLTRETRMLAWSDLRTGEAEGVCRVVVDHTKPPFGECFLDVTKAVNADLKKGFARSAFRIRDVFAETDGSPDNKAAGTWLVPGHMRLLVWETETGEKP